MQTLESGHHEVNGVMIVNVLEIFFMVALVIECCIAIIFLLENDSKLNHIGSYLVGVLNIYLLFYYYLVGC